MDFASLMNSQIAASKPNAGAGEKKYLKRSEVEAQREADYQREQHELEKSRLERLEKKRKRDEEEAERNRARDEKKRRLAEEGRKWTEQEQEAGEAARRKRLGLPELVKEDKKSTPLEDGEEDIDEEQLLEKLKMIDEPRRLFGETHNQRLRRYRRLQEKALAPKLSTGPIPTTIALVPEKDMKIPATVPDDEEGKAYLLRQIASYFDMLLSEWSLALSRRPAEVKASFTGKQAYSNFTLALSNLTPLFRKIESTTLSASLVAPIHEIVDLAQRKYYVDANDAYLRLSIGKAAWPIGVTMVGIHERSAREKLHESEKGGAGKEAHILADEVTRKMLQGIKRCLSFAQTRWPPDDLGQLMG
jgi:pre-mRNA-splicing factor 18